MIIAFGTDKDDAPVMVVVGLTRRDVEKLLLTPGKTLSSEEDASPVRRVAVVFQETNEDLADLLRRSALGAGVEVEEEQ